MRLSNLLIVFVIHACLSFYLLSHNSIDYTGFGSVLLFPARQFLNLMDTGFSGFMSYVPYLINSFIWSFLLNYFYGVLKNSVRNKFD